MFNDDRLNLLHQSNFIKIYLETTSKRPYDTYEFRISKTWEKVLDEIYNHIAKKIEAEDNNSYWNSLGEEELHNIDNMLEA